MSNEKENESIEKSSNRVPMKLDLGPTNSLDLSFLPENERKTLLIDYAKGIMDINKKAQELHIDAVTLKRTLDDLTDATKSASDNDNFITVSHTQTSKVGRTEVMMGNTEQAGKGRLSKSQTGEKDFTPYYIFAGILALVLIAALIRG